MRYTNTDVGQFRKALASLGDHGAAGVDRIYNTLNDDTGIRTLTVFQWKWNNKASYQDTPNMSRVRAVLGKVFGARYVSAKLFTSDGKMVLQLDDNMGQPFGYNASKPVKAVYNAPPRMTKKDHVNFWKAATDTSVHNKIAKRISIGTLITTKRPIRVFKAVKSANGGAITIANLTIPAGARVHITDSKSRASVADVGTMVTRFSHKPVTKAHSGWSPWFKYETGKTVTPQYFDDTCEVCAAGIHFFVDINGALNYCP